MVPLREEIADFSSYTNEILNNVNHIEMAGEVKRAYCGYCKKNRSVVEKAIKQLRMITVLFSIVSSYSVIIIFVVLLMGAQSIIRDDDSRCFIQFNHLCTKNVWPNKFDW